MTGAPYVFGPFRLDPSERRLTRDGTAIEVGSRYLDALALLAAEDGRLVTKDRFMEEVWRGVPVTDEALTQCIRALRKALGDDAANPRVIETVPRHGYRLMLRVESGGPEAATVAETAPSSREPIASPVVAAALGGACAGIVGALGYIALGLVAPRMGTASTLIVLLSANLLLGMVGGAAIGAGIAIVQRRWHGIGATALGGALGGAFVGALGRMIGTDLFTLFFGQTPARATGALEGTLLGLACGLAIGLSARFAAKPGALHGGIAVAAGAAAGAIIVATKGTLMMGSLAALAERFPAGKLDVAQVGEATLALTTIAEATLFTAGVSMAILTLRRLRR